MDAELPFSSTAAAAAFFSTSLLGRHKGFLEPQVRYRMTTTTSGASLNSKYEKNVSTVSRDDSGKEEETSHNNTSAPGADALSSSSAKETTTTTLYLHVGPSGDCWTGTSLFAAKHLQPDYIVSVALPRHLTEESAEDLAEALQQESTWAQDIYDTQQIPQHLQQRYLSRSNQEEETKKNQEETTT